METGMVARSQFDRVILLVYSREVVASSRHKGLEELYLTGKTRRIGPEYLRKCVRILAIPGSGDPAAGHERGRVQVPRLARQTAEMVRTRNRKLPGYVRLVRRKRRGRRF
jgi:hypothetical protein